MNYILIKINQKSFILIIMSKKMENINVIFTFDGKDIAIQCSKRDQVKSICQKFALKAETDLDSLIFLYAGNKVNFDLTLETQASSIDKKNKKMAILVYRKENEDELTCPKCGEKLKLNTQKIEELISFNNDLVDSISGIQDQLENVIKISMINKVNNQLKNIKTLMNTIIEDIKKNKIKLQNLSSDFINNSFQNNKGALSNPSFNKEVINKYNEKIKILEKQIENKDNIIKELKSIDINLKKEMEILKENQQKNLEIILKKEKEINAWKSSLSFGQKDFGQSMTVIIRNKGLIINYPIQCRSKQIFSTIENLIYEKFPQYKEINNIFLANGKLVNKYQTFEENGIRDGNYILMVSESDN